MAAKSPRKHEVIYETLRGRIRSGELSPGDKLPNERELAGEFQVATMTLRRALNRLGAEGYLIRRPYHGTHVASGEDFRGDDQNFRIGLVVPVELRALAHPVFSRLLNGIEGIASEMKSRIEFVVSHPANAAMEERFLQTIAEAQVDGWIIPANISDLVGSALKRSTAPKVLLHFPDEELSGHFFECDYQNLAGQIGEHLLENGYRRVAIFAPADISNLRERFPVLLEAVLTRAGGSVFVHEPTDWSAASSALACQDLLDREEPFDAIICEDDEMALGVMRVLKDHGLEAPRIGVIGAGDFPAGALVEPALTTVAFPYYQVGREITRLLCDLLLRHGVESAHRSFQPKLIVRASSQRIKPLPSSQRKTPNLQPAKNR